MHLVDTTLQVVTEHDRGLDLSGVLGVISMDECCAVCYKHCHAV